MTAMAKKKVGNADNAGVDKAPAVSVPKIGDTVLYAHRANGRFTLVPMIVTKVHKGGDVVDGVVLSADPYLMTNNVAAKPVRLIQKGVGEDTWQPRR